MTVRNPTVPIHVTANELRLLSDLLGYDTHCITLRDKLANAAKDMRLAVREANRERKHERREKKTRVNAREHITWRL